MSEDNDHLISATAEVVAAYVSNNATPAENLNELISNVYQSLSKLGAEPAEAVVPEQLVPAVSVKKSVTPDHLICLEDGKKFKSLKRHLRTTYNLSPEEYRKRWNLPSDYPMVAPAYAKTRSDLAKAMGLGKLA